MWPYSDEEDNLDEITADFSGVAQSIFEQAETEEAGLLALQDAFKSYEFPEPKAALSIFEESSSQVRKKFGDTKPFDFQTTLELAPRNFEEFSSDLPDPDQNNLDVINQWEKENIKALSEATDLNQIQLRPQLERSIKQIGAIKRREILGSDNYLVTDQALRMAQGAIGPIASLLGADSVTDFFTENTDPDGSNLFGYEVGGDNSYLSAVSSGLGSVAGAVGAGAVTGGWGTGAYLAASGAGAVRERVEDALENEATAGEAATAGLIEAGSQIGQTVVGAKVFGGVVNKILGKSPTALGARIYPQVLKSAGMEGATEGAGQIVSNLAQNVGRGDELDKDLLAGVPQSIVAGAVGGGVAEVGGEFLAKKDSQGNPITPDPDFPSDAEFLPGVVYHGTAYNVQDFDTKELGKSTGSPSAKKAFFASPQVQTAEFFGELSSKGKEDVSLPSITLKDKSWQEAKEAWKEVDRIYKEMQEYNKTVLDTKGKRDVLTDTEYLTAVATAKEKNKQNDEKAASVFNELKKKDAGTNIIPLRIRSTNPYIVDAKGKPDANGLINSAVSIALEKGNDAVIIKNMEGGGQYVAWFDPEQAYSPWEVKTRRKIRPDPLLEIEGEKPPVLESVPGNPVSTTLDSPGVPVAKLADGSAIVESDGKKHLVVGDKVVQAYDDVFYVAPETAQKLRQLQADGNPDGTAVTLTTDGKSLLVESSFLNEKLEPTELPTGRVRTPVEVSPSEQGAVPVFASKTRTTDGVRQNPSFIAPAPVESTTGAATAGFGNQYLTDYMKAKIDELGADVAEQLGFISISDVETPQGIQQVITPLTTKFKTSHANTGQGGAELFQEKGVLGSLEHLRTLDRFNEADVSLANILTGKLQQSVNTVLANTKADPSAKNLDTQSKVLNLFGEAVLLKDKVSTVFGRGLGSLTDEANAIHNAKAYAEFKIAQIETELTKSAYVEIEKQTGEPVDLKKWTEEAQAADAEVKAVEAKANEIQKSKDAVDKLKLEKNTLESDAVSTDAEIETIESQISDLDKPKKKKRKTKGPSDEQITDAQDALAEADEIKKQRRDLLNKLKAAKKRREVIAAKDLLATKRLAEAEAKATENEKLAPEVKSQLADAKKSLRH